jgi:hypothetical protein
MLKTVIITLSFMLSSLVARDLSLENTIQDIYYTLKDKKESIFNTKYIHKDIGIYVVYRLGIYDSVKHLDKVSLVPTNEPTFLSIQNSITTLPTDIKYKKVTYSCDKEEWSDSGYFVYKTNKVQYIKEKNLYHFVDTFNDISFYLKYIDGLWYIILLDEVSSDCSA